MMVMSLWKKYSSWIILLVVVIAAFGGYKYYQGKQASKTAATVKTGTVEQGDIRSTISATGSLSAVDNVDINSKITGRIVEVYVVENQHVEAGQILLKLDDSTYKATETQKQARLNNAELTYNRYLKLQAAGAIARSQLDTAEADYIVAKADYEQAVANTRDTVISSPIAGYVIGKPTPVGQTVSSGISSPQVLMSVANLDEMEIKLMVDEADIGQVQLGQRVEFTVDAYPEKTYEGKVTLISRSATTTNNVNYYTVYVNVSNPGGKLLPTMTARADIIVGEVKDKMTVPINCLKSNGKKKYVQVYNVKTKEARDVEVKVLMTGDDRVAVEGDLKAGDTLSVKEVKINKNGGNRGGMGGMLGGPRR